MSRFNIVALPAECLASGTVRCGVLVGGSVFRMDEAVQLLPPPELWDSAGIRMGLEDERHPKEPSATLQARLSLHVTKEGQ